MTYTQKLSFEDYLALEDTGYEGCVELIDGELVELPPEARINTEIAAIWFAALLASGVSVLHLKMGCEIQTPVLERGDAANRFPDVVVIREEHRSLTQKRMTITLEMPPPSLCWKLSVRDKRIAIGIMSANGLSMLPSAFLNM